MNKKLVLAIASLALIMTGSALPRSLFARPPQARITQTSAANNSAADDDLTAEAFRHCHCQPRHWRSMVLQK